MVKLTDKKIEWAVKQAINKGESTELVAAVYGVSRRGIRQLVKYHRETGRYPMLDKKLRYHIQKHYKRNISHNKIHQHLLEVGLARPNLKKQKT